MILLRKLHASKPPLQKPFFQRFFVATENEILFRKYKVWTEKETNMLKEAFNKYNKRWTKIAEEVGTRTVEQCQRKFKSLSGGGRYTHWTKEEDEKLISLAEKYGRSWSTIATYLPHRLYDSIFKRFHGHLNPDLKKDELNSEERKKLFTLYEQYPEKWHKIAKILNSAHSSFFLKSFFRKFERNYFKKGTFSPEEDATIIDFFSKNGRRWTELAARLNRPYNSVRTRWEDVLNPRLVKGKWSREEEQHLLHFASEHGKKWRTYSNLTDRGYLQIYYKYNNLIKCIAKTKNNIQTD